MGGSFLHFLVLLGLCNSALAVFSTSDCGTTKTCFRLPASCDPASADCVFFSWTWDGTSFEMELSGGTGGGSEYSAVAFGQVDDMVDADLYFCTGTALESGIITQRGVAPTKLDIATEAGITITSQTTANGVAECTFTRTASITKTITDGSNKDFNLSSGRYYVLLAAGAVDSSSGNVLIHTARVISTSTFDMTASPSTTTTTTAASTTTAAQAAGCGSTKGCFQTPSGCAEGAGCTYFTWVYNSASNNWNMEISSDAAYAAVAFGQVKGMTDADLYYCTASGLTSGAITTNRVAPQVTASLPTGVALTSSSNTNGIVKCIFTRVASINKPTVSGTHDYDLSTNSYYVLLAKGTVSGSAIQYHNNARAISDNKIDLTANTGSGAAGVNILAKTHGALMITAWLVLVNVGVLIARHFKPLWPKTQPGGVQLWFTFHRTIMVTVLLLTAIAFIIIFVHVNGYSTGANSHAIIGIIVMCLTILNPTIALFRPHPGTKNRWIFNMFHIGIGLVARSLGIANLFLGVGAINAASWAVGVLGGMVGWVVIFEVGMEIISWQCGHGAYSKKKSQPEPAADGDLQMEEPDVRVRGQGLKTALLIIYALGLIAFAIAFYVDIASL